MRIVLSSVTINITTTWIHTTPMNGIQSLFEHGCENEVNNGVVANQFGSWPLESRMVRWSRCQAMEFDITSWVDMNGQNNELTYRGLFNGQEYNQLVSRAKVDETSSQRFGSFLHQLNRLTWWLTVRLRCATRASGVSSNS